MIEKPPVEILERRGYAVVRPRGYLNGPTGERIDAACSELMRRGVRRIVINFDETETMNTTGVSNLIAVLQKAGRRDGTVCFSNLMATNREMLDVLDISRAVLIFESEAEAAAHLEQSAAPRAEGGEPRI